MLSALLNDRDAIAAVVGIVGPSDFWFPDHGMVYQAMLNLWTQKVPADLTTLAHELATMDETHTQIGWTGVLAGIIAEPTIGAHATYYAATVKEMATKRHLIAMASQIVKMAYDTRRSAAQVLGAASTELARLGATSQATRGVAFDTAVDDLADQLEAAWANPASRDVLPTGLRALDRLISGAASSAGS